MSKGAPPLSKEAQNFQHGRYQHFKGGLYKTICVAQDSEEITKELVIYQSIEHGYICARPLSMFIENVDRDGYKGPRFKYLGK